MSLLYLDTIKLYLRNYSNREANCKTPKHYWPWKGKPNSVIFWRNPSEMLKWRIMRQLPIIIQSYNTFSYVAYVYNISNSRIETTIFTMIIIYFQIIINTFNKQK